MVFILSYFFLHESSTKLKIMALFLSLAGVMITCLFATGNTDIDGEVEENHTTLAGIFWTLLSTMLFALFEIYSKVVVVSVSLSFYAYVCLLVCVFFCVMTISTSAKLLSIPQDTACTVSLDQFFIVFQD